MPIIIASNMYSTKTKIKINGQEVTSYKKKGFNYYLLYGMNLNTGKVNWYTYDSEEKTLQRYIESDNISIEKSNDYLFLIYILGGVIGLLIIFIMILFIKYKRKWKVTLVAFFLYIKD